MYPVHFPRRTTFVAALALLLPSASRATDLAPKAEDQLWLHRNLGAVHFVNDSWPEASRELSAAFRLAPRSAGDARNAGVAHLLAGDLEKARAALDTARRRNPSDPAVLYAWGILEKRAANADAARAALLACREHGGTAPELAYNLGILAVRARDSETALAEFERVLAIGPDLAPRHHASALYRAARTLIQLGRRAEGTEYLREYKALVKAGKGAQLSEEDLEGGELMELADFDRPADVRAAGPLPVFRTTDLPGGPITWAECADLDEDGDRDFLLGDGNALHDLRTDADGARTDVTGSRGLAGLTGVTHARALDMDNDGTVDLLRCGADGIHLHPGVSGAWEVSQPVFPDEARSFCPVDFDHDGDIDLLACTPGGLRLLRNHGDRTFSDATAESGLSGAGAVSLGFSGDLDDDMDVDLLLLTEDGRALPAESLRGGVFRLHSALDALPSGAVDLLLGDFDSDGDLDIAAAGPDGVHLASNEGALRFAPTAAPALSGRVTRPVAGGRSLWSADFDNDGRLDLLAASATGAALALNEGGFAFVNATAALATLSTPAIRPVAPVLADSDGRMDLIIAGPTARLATHIGEVGGWVVLEPVGVKNNLDGLGTQFELLAGSRYARREGKGGPVHFGLGPQPRVDAIRVRWPNGILQGVTDATPGTLTTVEEKAGLVGSCPFLYTFDGHRLVYITDILSVTPLGLPIAPGFYVPPDWDEAIRVTSRQLQPDADGYLVAQVTEELREVTYLDRVQLYAIDHPEHTEAQPNEKFKFPPFPEFGVHLLDEHARPPATAIDHEGRPVTERLLEIDDLVVGDLPLTQYQGITKMHALELDFGEVPPDAPLTLHLTGWFFWTNASINIAISQDPRHDFIPPSILVDDGKGGWSELPIEVGFPAGKMKSIPVDLTGAFPHGRARLRISTTLRIYWDRARLQVGAPSAQPVVRVLSPDSAHLHYRGFSEPIFSASGEEPERFEYDELRATDPPWDPHAGLYTKYGDVTPLVLDPEDMFVIMATGDECTLKWRADRLPPLAPGLQRTYLFLFEGWAKDGDPNTSLAQHVRPLPFHAMSGYPYGAQEHYPDDPLHRAYQAEWNTRRASRVTRDFVADAARAPGTTGSR